MLLITANDEYPRFQGDLELAHPDWKEGDALPDGWRIVVQSEVPEMDYATEIAEEGFPVEVNGVWQQNWVVRKLTAEELERMNAPKTAKEKLVALGLSDLEVEALVRGLVR